MIDEKVYTKKEVADAIQRKAVELGRWAIEDGLADNSFRNGFIRGIEHFAAALIMRLSGSCDSPNLPRRADVTRTKGAE